MYVIDQSPTETLFSPSLLVRNVLKKGFNHWPLTQFVLLSTWPYWLSRDPPLVLVTRGECPRGSSGRRYPQFQKRRWEMVSCDAVQECPGV